jgi:signal transduction histidine kinase/CheY-like chemotaxis protein
MPMLRGAFDRDVRCDRKDARVMPMTAVETRRRLGVAQIEALFGSVPVGVGAAAVASAILAAGMGSLGFVELWTGVAWVGYLQVCALCNLTLRFLYQRSRPRADRWRVWALWFTAINFAGGIGFGWAPLGLTTGGRLDVELAVLLVTLCMAAGSIPAFSPYLPAFVLFFLPATLPFTAASFFSTDPLVHRLGPVLLTLFIGGMGGLGIRANRSFEQLVSLRIRTEEMAADLQRQKDIAERANLAKSRFLAAASHDLRQPVHALGLFVGALRGVAIAPEGRRLIDQIEASIAAMHGLFNALLDISRLDAGVVAAQRRPFAIRSVLDRVCRDYAPEAEAKGVSLVWVDCAAVVDTDPALMDSILRNLVSNAVRYTDRGRILVGCRRSGTAISVQVWDTGAGIPQDQQAHVFQEFYQLGNPERDRAKGLGLGLAIVRRLTDLLGCELKLRSTPGEGSCFEVFIPLATEAASAEEPSPDDPQRALSGRLIVVVDDEQPIREAMSGLLADWGHRVISASSGEEAIARLSTCPARPDLLICDYRLPGEENGVGVIKRLRSEYNEPIPAILITGDTAPSRLAEAEASGVLLLHKPVNNAKMRAAIFNLIALAEDAGATDDEPSSVK